MPERKINNDFFQKRAVCLVERLDDVVLDSNVKQFCENVATKVNLTKRAGDGKCSSGKLNIPQERLDLLLNDLAALLNDDGFDVNESLGHKRKETATRQGKPNETPKRGAAKRKPKPKVRRCIEAPISQKRIEWSPFKESSETQWFQPKEGYTSLKDAYPALFEENSDEVKLCFPQPKRGRPKNSDPLMIPPFMIYTFAANSAVFQVPKRTSKNFVLDDTRKMDEKFAILPNSQSTQLDQVTRASEKPEVRKRSRQTIRSEISSNDSTQFIQNFIERVKSHDPNASFGLLTFKQLPLKNVRVIYGSEESRQYKPILPKNEQFTKVQLADFQIANIDTNRLSSTQQNELSFQRVTFSSVFGGYVGSNSLFT